MAAQAVSTCKWAIPTLFLPWPLWYDASSSEWSCTRGREPRGLPDPGVCATCARWTLPSATGPSEPSDAHLGSVAP